MVETVVEIAIEATLVLGVAFAVTRLMRNTSAAARHLVWSATVVALLALPLLEIAVPWRVGVVPAIEERVEPTASTRAAAEPAVVAEPGAETAEEDALARSTEPATGAVATRAAATPPSAGEVSPGSESAAALETTASGSEAGILDGLDWSRVALFAWILGLAFVAGRLLLSTVSVWFLARRAQPVTSREWYGALGAVTGRLALRTPVRLVRSERTAMPITTGVMRPAVVLPAGSGGWSEERRHAVLLHELAHVRRYDVLVHWLAWIACAVYWFHPLVWMAANRLRHESERACDDLVLESGTLPSAYAEHLLEIVRTAGLGRAPALAMPMAQRSKFEGRLLAILEPDVTRGAVSRFGAAGALAAALIVAVPLAAMGPATPEADAPAAVVEAESSGDEPTAFEEPDTRIGKVEAEGPLLAAGPLALVPDEVQIDEGQIQDEEGVGDAKSEEAAKEADAKAQRRVGALVSALRDSDPEVRSQAARALGEFEDPRSIEALSRALREDESPEVRRMAAWALGEIEKPAAIPALARAVQRDEVAEVRKMAAWALGEIEHADGIEALGEALDDESVEVRRMAIWALGEIESPRVVPWIAPALRDADAEIRQKAAWALGEIESPEAVEVLGRAIGDDDPEVRMTVVWALGEIEDERAVPWLERALSDASPGVRKKATWALGEIESVRAVGPLSRALADENAEVRKSAAWGIGEIQPDRAPEALVDAVGDPDPEVRKMVAWALGEIEDPVAVPALRRLLGDDDREVQKTALWALMEMDDDVAQDTLIELLQDDDPEVRKEAARALGERE